MAGKEEILANLKKAVETQDIDSAEKSAKEALDAGIKPFDAINKGLAKGMETISDQFDRAEIYLPQIMLSADAMEKALEVFKPAIEKAGEKGKGIYITGTVEGDIHAIGKNVCASMMRGAGYTVVNLGTDVPSEEFAAKAKELGADLVGASALMSTSKPVQRKVQKVIEEVGGVKTVYGGAVCTEEWVKEIGGDAFCPNGAEIVKTADRLLG